MQKGIGVGGAIILVGLMMVATIVSIAYLGGLFQIEGAPRPPTRKAPEIACNPEATGGVNAYITVVNPLNKTGTELKSKTVRIYEGELKDLPSLDGGNYEEIEGLSFVGTLAVDEVNEKWTGAECGKTYTAIVVSSDGNDVSGWVTWTQDENEKHDLVIESPDQAGLIFRVYDESNRAYVYAQTDTKAGEWHSSGASFYSTTGNATGDSDGLTLGTDGYFIYTLYFKQNSSAAVDTQFSDKELLMAINADDLSDWQEPTSIESPYFDFEKVTCPSKISNLGYDWCYVVTTEDGEVPPIKTSERSVKIEMHAKSGVNPSDDITIAFFTSGIVKETVGNDVIYGYTKDDASESLIFTQQTATFVIG